MAKFNKFFGSIVGGIVGIVLVSLGVDEALIPAAAGPITDALTVLLGSALGTYAFPANKQS